MQETEREQYYPLLETPDNSSKPVTPSPNDPPWNSLAAIGTWIFSVLMILIVPSILIMPYILTREDPITDAAALAEFAKNDTTAIFIQIAAILPAHILTILLAWLVVTKGRKYKFLEMLGWKKGGVAWWHYIVVLALFLLVSVIVGSVLPEQENEVIRIIRSSRMAVFALAFMATLSAPFVEEVIYRGVLYSAFQRTFGVSAAFILVTILFSLVHVPQYWPSFSTIILLTILSMTLTAMRVWSGNLLPCIIFHTIFNGLQSIFMIIEPYINTGSTQ